MLELVLVAAGSTTVSPAFRPLRTIVEVLPARPVTTRWRTSLPPRTTVTESARDGGGRHVHPFGLLDDDFGGGAHARLQPGCHLVELEGDVVADDAAAAGREGGHFADVSRQLAPAQALRPSRWRSGRPSRCRFPIRSAPRRDASRRDRSAPRRRSSRSRRSPRPEEDEDEVRAGRAARRRGAAGRGADPIPRSPRSCRWRPWSCRWRRRLRRPGPRARRSCRSAARTAWCRRPPLRRSAPSVRRS